MKALLGKIGANFASVVWAGVMIVFTFYFGLVLWDFESASNAMGKLARVKPEILHPWSYSIGGIEGFREHFSKENISIRFLRYSTMLMVFVLALYHWVNQLFVASKEFYSAWFYLPFYFVLDKPTYFHGNTLMWFLYYACVVFVIETLRYFIARRTGHINEDKI